MIHWLIYWGIFIVQATLMIGVPLLVYPVFWIATSFGERERTRPTHF